MDRRRFLRAVGAGSLALAVEPVALATRLGGAPVAFVTADLESHVVVFDVDTARVVKRIRTGPGPRSIESVQDRIAVVAHTEHGVVTLLDVDLGFQPEHAVAWRVDMAGRFSDGQGAEKVAFYERLVASFQAVPGVEAVGFTDTLPLGRNRGWGIRAKGVDYPKGGPGAQPRMVDHGYIETMRIPVIKGRNFNAYDTRESERVIVLNEAAANTLWPGEDPIGKIALVKKGDVKNPEYVWFKWSNGKYAQVK